LLREIHHRVKNNLQVVSSLLNLQSGRIVDESARALFADSQARVRSIAMLHEKLYRSGDLARVEMDTYLSDLVSELRRSRGLGVTLDVTVDGGGISLEIDAAVPCGLIVNELVTNALKHAFLPGARGKLTVGLRRLGAGRLELSVEDDGVGLPAQVDPKKSSSLGMELVHTLTDQLSGTLEIRREPCTAFVVSFPGGA